MNNSYKNAGVDINAGNQAVERMKNHVKKTYRKEVISGIGGFGGLFALQDKYKNPVLVSGSDGVGTKLKIAIEANQHDSVGIDLVAMCVNDILVQGAEPLFFLDYIATGKLHPEKIEEIVKGIAEGCLQANCSLIGGETAEMPGMYSSDDYDLAGFAVGVVERNKIIDGSKIEVGNSVIGLASSGIHSNGYSLVRYLLSEQNKHSLDDYILELDNTLKEELLKPTRIYVKSIVEVMKKLDIKGMAHITGGGLLENIPRVLPKGLQAEIKLDTWEAPPIFKFLKKVGKLENEELYRTFNMGIGFVLVVEEKDKDKAMNMLRQLGEDPFEIGKITKGNQKIVCLGDELK